MFPHKQERRRHSDDNFINLLWNSWSDEFATSSSSSRKERVRFNINLIDIPRCRI